MLVRECQSLYRPMMKQVLQNFLIVFKKEEKEKKKDEEETKKEQKKKNLFPNGMWRVGTINNILIEFLELC